ncbi:transcription elongation factor B polypeptide 3-like [Penaeus chinensis]|uniref:transcription elongation factor B polypeptide 3-like n=1 Tax=Penaeus chinensis TaxID=139456 RepID=UPI001FB7A029|nr:transcription elongation factor B polypeptide 3-like [Penaeus chinensis]
MSNVAEQIALYQRKLEKYAGTGETDKLLYYIHKLKYLQVTVSHLEETGVGRSVNALRHHSGLVGDKARALVNKWKMMVTAEEEEEEEEEEEDDDRQRGDHTEEDRGGGRINVQQSEREEEEDEGAVAEPDDEIREEEDEEDRLQIEECGDIADDFEDEVDSGTYGYGQQSSPAGGENSNGYNPYTSQKDYQLLSGSSGVSTEYHPSSTDAKASSYSSPEGSSGPSWKEASPSISADRRNGSSSSKSSSKKNSKEDKDRHREKERHKEREKERTRDGSGSHEKDRKKDHKEKHKDKHRDKDRDKSHKDKHRDKDRSSDKPKEEPRREESADGQREEKDRGKKKDVLNGFSTPEIEKRSAGKHESRDGAKRNVDEKRKEKSEKSSHGKLESTSKESSREKEGRDKHDINKEGTREKESSSKESNRDRDRRKEEKHRDKHRDSSKKDKDKSDREPKSDHREIDEGSESDRKDLSKKKKSKKHDVSEGLDFGAALMGLESPVKKKKKKKKKDSQKDRESSDEGQPSSSKSSNKRMLSDGGGLPDAKKQKLLAKPPPLPSLPSSISLPPEEPLLPEITPNYKPLPRLQLKDDPMEHMSSKMTEEEALNFMFQSKNNRRSKMYSGKVSGLAYVPTLYEACIRVLQENIDALEFTGGIPFEILQPVLERASPQQLITLEDYNSYLLEDTDVLWETHCKKDFKNKKLEDMETWREMWIRCFDERERKLKNLTQKLGQKFVSKAEPKRTTKLAFVDTACKVPKNVARAQAKYGTAVASSSAAKPGKANEVAARKTAMQNVQRAERAAANPPRPTAAKNKKVAPLMAKTRQFFKKAFRR